jgi:carboxyl-terminal processing protease
MSPRTRLAVAVVSTALIGYIAAGSLLSRVLGDSSYGQLAIFNEVVRLVLDAYVEPVNVDRAMAGARQGMSDALDGDSAYLEPEDFRIAQQPLHEGDADVGLVVTRRFAFVMIVAPRPGSAAAKAGLRAGDIVKTIDGRHTRQMPAIVADRALHGAPGSSVKLAILRAGADPFDVTLVRERMLPAAPESRTLDASTGYLRVSDFTPATADEVRTKVEALKKGGAKSLVLDLRDAAWGAPGDGVKVAEVFLKGGPIGKLVGRHAEEQLFQADPSRSSWSGPLVVLTNNGTAGPAEVVAAAIADAERAKLVGERTFGRAGISRTIPLPDGGLILTTAKYVSPKGTAIHGEGLKPAVAVDATPDEDEDLPKDAPRPDHILDKALEVLHGTAPAARAAA